jgi:hypothetical protein
MRLKNCPAITSISLMLFIFTGCNSKTANQEEDKKQIAIMLDSFNIAAAKADFDNYFKNFTEDAIFIGTDATEHWNKKDFMAYAKPHFDKGRAWSFTSIDRHIFFDKTGNTAWFDELLDTQMKICRGSGVVLREGNHWKISQYVLSMTIPNSKSDTIVKIKSSEEDSIISSLKNKR